MEDFSIYSIWLTQVPGVCNAPNKLELIISHLETQCKDSVNQKTDQVNWMEQWSPLHPKTDTDYLEIEVEYTKIIILFYSKTSISGKSRWVN